MKQHVNKCKKYREVYKIKLSSKKVSDLIKDQIKMYERDLDEVNIRIQRQVSNTSTFLRAFFIHMCFAWLFSCYSSNFLAQELRHKSCFINVQ